MFFRLRYLLLSSILSLAGSLLLFVSLAHAATFTVTNTNDSGAGSLRQAIIDANSSGGIDTINFSIAFDCPQIAPTSSFPVITDPVIIDASAQGCSAGTAEAPNVELSGHGLAGSQVGLRITSSGSGSTVRGLTIVRFS